MHFVPVKSVTQQAQGMVLKVRESLVGQRTLLVNTLRGHAAEFGVLAHLLPVGPGTSRRRCEAVRMGPAGK
jgi:transposase